MTGASEGGASAAAGWAPAGVLRSAGKADAADLGPNQATFPLTWQETADKYSLTEFSMAPPPAPGPPPHIHEDADEAVYVLEGELEMGLGERKPCSRTSGGPSPARR